MKSGLATKSFSRCARIATALFLSAIFLLSSFTIVSAADDGGRALTPDELSQMSEEEVAEVSQAQSDATLSKMADLFMNGEHDALNSYLDSLGIVTTYEDFEMQRLAEQPTIQPLWQSDYTGEEEGKMCHEAITSSGFLLYIGAMQELFGISGSFGYTLSDMQILSANSGYPDEIKFSLDYPGVTISSHFYNPETGKGLLRYPISARDNSEVFYNTAAMTGSFTSNREKALKNLSYALHFIQDMGVPQHCADEGTAGEIFDPYNHAGFEALASQILLNKDESFLDNVVFEHDRRFYEARLSQGIGDFVHAIATNSLIWLDYAKDTENITRQRLAAVVALTNSIYNTAGVLYKYAKEIHII